MRSTLTASALTAALALLLLASGCGGDNGGGSGSLAAGIAATVAGEEITRTQLDEVIAQAEGRMKAQGQKIPAAGSQEYQAFQQNALQYLVQRVQFEQKAEELGVEVTEKEIDERFDRVLTQFFGGSKKKYEQALKKQNITTEQVRDELRAQLLSEKIFAKVGKSAEVTDAEIKEYYDANPQLYGEKVSREVRHVVVPSKALANDLYRQLKTGADFASLAKKYSTDPGSKDTGGKLTVRRGETVPEFDKVAFSLKVGELSQPVKTSFGWHVIEALSKETKGRATPLSEVRKSISDTLASQKQSETIQKWLEDLKQEYEGKVTYASGLAPPATETTTGTTATG